jgi:hypothetical protein
MIYEACWENGILLITSIDWRGITVIRHRPCPMCGGCGRIHCCEGDREQPDE